MRRPGELDATLIQRPPPADQSLIRIGLANRYLSCYLSIVTDAPSTLDLAFQALGDPSRRAMVERLAQGPASVSELAKPLAMSLPAVMQHLAVLEESGLVRSEKVGRVRTCRIDPSAITTAERWLNERRQQWEQRFDRLGAFLTQQDDPQE